MRDGALDHDDEDVTRPAAVTRALSASINAMRVAENDLGKLLAVRDGAGDIAPYGDRDALDHISDVAINMHDLDTDTVQQAIGDGIRESEMAKRAQTNGAPRSNNSGADKAKGTGTDDNIVNIILPLPQFLATLVVSDYLVDGLFKYGFLYSITAMTGGGKTAAALLLAVAVADPKRRWKFGPHEVEHGRVLYVTRENPAEVKERLIGMAQQLNFEPEEFANTLLFIENVSDINKAFERIQRELKSFGDVVLIILDTSAALFVGDDENSSIEMLKHAKTQRKLTELSGHPCVIALNHPIKRPCSPNDLLPRGGGGYLNEVDGNFTLWAHDDKLSDFHTTGKLRGPDFDPITFRMVTVYPLALKDKKGRLMPTVMARWATEEEIADDETKSTSQEDLLLKAINKNPKGSMASWAAACGWFLASKVFKPREPNKALVQRVMGRLMKAKLIKKEGRGYTLTKAGKVADTNEG